MLVDWVQELLLLLPSPLAVLANLADSRSRSAVLRYAGQFVNYAVPTGVLALGAIDLLYAPLSGAQQRGLAISGAGFVAAGLVALAIQSEPVLRWLGRWLPIDPARQVHRLAVVLSLLIVLTQLVTQLSTDVLASQANHASLTRLDLVLQEVPFLLAAFAGVGLGVRRGPRASLQRLGIVRPAPWQVVAAIAAGGAFYAFGTGMDHLGEVITPDLARKVQATTDHLFARLTDPLGVATVAVAAGVCEELLFRGALQPRLGLLWVAVVFTSVHTQYGLSIDTAAVLILACGLGLVRRFANTTTSMLCHVTYNSLVGFGVGAIGILPAVGLEVVLVATAALGFAYARAQPAPARS